MTARALVLCTAGLLIATELPAQENDKQELEKLQGEWVMVSREGQRAEKIPADYVEESKLTIKGDRWTSTYRDNVTNSTVRIDPSKEPKTLDRLFETARNRMIKRLCIYKLENSTLTICSESGSDGVLRPKEFNTGKDGGILIVFKRATK